MEYELGQNRLPVSLLVVTNSWDNMFAQHVNTSEESQFLAIGALGFDLKEINFPSQQ